MGGIAKIRTRFVGSDPDPDLGKDPDPFSQVRRTSALHRGTANLAPSLLLSYTRIESQLKGDRLLHHCLDTSNHLICGSGGNCDNLVEEPFVGRFSCCNFPTIEVLVKKIYKIPTTTRNPTV